VRRLPCADDPAQLADCAAIGTAGSPAEAEAEAEAEHAIAALEKLDKARADSLNNLVHTPLGEPMTMEDLCLGDSTELVVDTAAGRATSVCCYIHTTLIANRRPALEAMKRGFVYAADLRPALAMFTAAELTDMYLRQVWADPDQIRRSFVFQQWNEEVGSTTKRTPELLIELVAKWGDNGALGQRRLTQFLIWATGSDDLGDCSITVQPGQSAAHLPVASTCSRTITLPPSLGTVEELQEKLVVAFSNGTFGRA
jgi:hypothetical protein